MPLSALYMHTWRALLPAHVLTLTVLAQPSMILDKKTAEIRTNLAGPAWEEGAAFGHETGWALIRHATVESGRQARPVQSGAMTMNDALTWIEREAVDEGITLYRKSWYGDRVELGFLTPELGRNYAKWLDARSDQIGVPIQVAQSVNQRALMSLVGALLREGNVPMVGQPSVFLADKTVAARIAGAIPESVQEAFRAQTGGWTLRVL